MRTSVCGIPVRVSPALPLVMIVLAQCGMGASMAAFLISLFLHEVAHVLAARALGVRMVEMDLMPFGGAARLENAWAVRPGRMLAVALAGPMCNLLLALSFSALGWAGMLTGETVWRWMTANIVLMLFNLIPALPLDGGRALFGMLGQRFGARRAVKWGVNAGRALAALLIVWAACAGIFAGIWNLTPILCAVFLIASGAREREMAGGAPLVDMLGKSGALSGERVMPVRWLAAASDASDEEIAARFTPGYVHRVCVYDQDMRGASVREEADIFRGMLKKHNSTGGETVV